jgi:hypothetical protein
MDENTKQGVWICTMFIVFGASIAGIGGLVNRQFHLQKIETYNLVSKCRQQVKENIDVICGPLPKFND